MEGSACLQSRVGPTVLSQEKMGYRDMATGTTQLMISSVKLKNGNCVPSSLGVF